jgi:hypothetical protein
MGNFTVSWPVAPKVYGYFTGSAGIEVLLIYFHDYNNPDNSEFHGASDFAWQIAGGVAYELGPRSDVLFELGYHYSQPSWDYDVTDPSGQTRTFQRSFDMSGFMIRTGFRFYF